MSGNAGQQENIMNPGYQPQQQGGYQPVYTEQQGQGPGYYFSPFDYPAQQWPNREMFMADMSMQNSGLYDYLQGIKTWYPEPKGRGGSKKGGPSMFQPDHFGPNIGASGASSPHGISPHGFGTGRGQSLGRSQRESDQGYRVETTPGKTIEGTGILGMLLGDRQGPESHEVYSVDSAGNRYGGDDFDDR